MGASESSVERDIGAALARITSEFYGRGPRTTRTWVLDRIVFSALHEPFTVADEALMAVGRQALVRDVRLTFQDVMARSFVQAVESLTGRVVVGYHSQIVFEPAVAMEWFILDEKGASVAPAGDEPGTVGDADAVTADAPSIAPGPPVDAGGDGAQRAAISNAVNRIVTATTGRGSPAARTYVLGPFVLVVLEAAMTTVERTLIESGSGELARELRRQLTETMAEPLGAAVTEATGRGVAAIEAQLVASPDAVLLAFVLDEADGSLEPARS